MVTFSSRWQFFVWMVAFTLLQSLTGTQEGRGAITQTLQRNCASLFHLHFWPRDVAQTLLDSRWKGNSVVALSQTQLQHHTKTEKQAALARRVSTQNSGARQSSLTSHAKWGITDRRNQSVDICRHWLEYIRCLVLKGWSKARGAQWWYN